ncbi:MAG: DUF4214 domain-containing protein [Lachnospiraceae bacterium]|nr:DUF4214 domain-containing protein [Lachnospiraceae bacterium]
MKYGAFCRFVAGFLTGAVILTSPGAGMLARAEDPDGTPDVSIEEASMEGLIPALDPALERLGGELTEDPDGDLAEAVQSTLPGADGYVVTDPTAAVSTNIHYEYSGYYNTPVYSYLVPIDAGGFYRVEYLIADKQIVVETYDASFKLTASKRIDPELTKFGGFYAASDAYYFVFGDDNTEESDSKEVLRVVKYNKSWVRQSNVCSVYGANTYQMFRAGTVSMVDTDDYLYIRTCHTMYESAKDSAHHQANLQLVVKKSNMTLSDYLWKVSNESQGYFSHSFDQKLALDGDRVLTADLGDAYPRGYVFGYYGTNANSGSIHSGSSVSFAGITFMTFHGEKGENYTGAMLGGLESASSGYLVTGSLISQNDAMQRTDPYNAFVTTFSKSSVADYQVNYLTSYARGGQLSASNVHLVKLSEDLLVAMWEEKRLKDGSYQYPDKDPVVHYQYLNGAGEKVGAERTISGSLSKCRPVVIGGEVTWYVTNNSAPVFYTLPLPADEAKIRNFVTRMYQIVLGRNPEGGEDEGWVQYLVEGEKSAIEVAAGFYFSPEFNNRNFCNEHYVLYLYRGLFNRTPEENETTFWVDKLTTGSSREKIFDGFSESREFANLCAEYGMKVGKKITVPAYGTIPTGHCTYEGCNKEAGVREFVTRLYRYTLDREPEEEGMEHWVQKICSHEDTGRHVMVYFMNSPEFQSHNYDDEAFVDHLYLVAFGRHPEPDGLAFWKDRLAKGRTRSQVSNEVADSQEFLNLCNLYGIQVGDWEEAR